MSNVTIGYWGGFHGLGIQVHLAAALAGVKYEFKPVLAKEEYYGGLDQSLDTNFPNLPYIIDNGKVISQTFACMQHLAYAGGKEELVGKTPAEKIFQIQFSGVVGDIRGKFIGKNFTNPNWKDEKDNEYETIKPLVARVYKELGDKKFIAGDNVTIGDIPLFQSVSIFTKLYGDKFTTDFPNFQKFIASFSALPEIDAFFNSSNFDKNMTWLPPFSVYGV